MVEKEIDFMQYNSYFLAHFSIFWIGFVNLALAKKV